jgi:flagellar capping protein FliD
MKVFASSEGGPGIAEKLSNAVKGMQDRDSGVISLRQKSLEQNIRRQDQNIERQQRIVYQKHERLQKTFADLNGKMQMMQSQQDGMAAKING